jgi:hypothetical protein
MSLPSSLTHVYGFIPFYVTSDIEPDAKPFSQIRRIQGDIQSTLVNKDILIVVSRYKTITFGNVPKFDMSVLHLAIYTFQGGEMQMNQDALYHFCEGKIINLIERCKHSSHFLHIFSTCKPMVFNSDFLSALTRKPGTAG